MRANTFCALQHDFVRMQTRFTSLQQTIRGSIWPLHRCSKRFGGRNDRYIVAATHSVGRTGFYIVATRHNSYVTYGYVAGSIKFASVPAILPSNAPTSLTFLQSCRQKRHERWHILPSCQRKRPILLDAFLFSFDKNRAVWTLITINLLFLCVENSRR